MSKKSASGVLASLRGSTYRSVDLASSLAAALIGEMRVLACLADSSMRPELAKWARRGAGENEGLFEHPAPRVERARAAR